MSSSLKIDYSISHFSNMLGRVVIQNRLLESTNNLQPIQKISAKTIVDNKRKLIITSIRDEFIQSNQISRSLLPELKPYIRQHHELFFLVDVLFYTLKDLTLSALSTHDIESHVTAHIQNCLRQTGENMIRLAIEHVKTSEMKEQHKAWRLKVQNAIQANSELLEAHGCSIIELKRFTQIMLRFLEDDCYLSLANPFIMLYHPNCTDNKPWNATIAFKEEPDYVVPLSVRELSNTVNLSMRYAIESFDRLCQLLSQFVLDNSENEAWQAICRGFEQNRETRDYSKRQLLDPKQIKEWLPSFRARYLAVLNQLNQMNWNEDLEKCADINKSLEPLSGELNDSFCNQRASIEANKGASERSITQPLEDLQLCYLVARHSISGHVKHLIKICAIFSTHRVAIQKLLTKKEERQAWQSSLYQPQPLVSAHFLNACQPPLSLDEWATIEKGEKTARTKKQSQRKPTPKPAAKQSKQSKQSERSHTSASLKPASSKPVVTKTLLPASPLALSKRLLALRHLNPVACSRFRPEAFHNLIWLTHQLESFMAPKSGSLDALPPYVSLSMIAATVGWAIEQTYTMQLPPEADVNHDLLHMHTLAYPKIAPPAIVQQLAPINHWLRFWNEHYEQHLFSNQSSIPQEALQLLQGLNETGLTLIEQKPTSLNGTANQLLRDGTDYLHSLLDFLLKDVSEGPDEFGTPSAPIQPLANSIEELGKWGSYVTAVAKTTRKNYGLITQQKARQLIAMQLSVQKLVEQLPQQTTIYQAITSASWILHWTHEIVAESLVLLIYERSGHYESHRQINYLIAQVPDLELNELVKWLNQVHNKVRYPLNYAQDSIASQLIDNLHQLTCAPELEQGFTLVSRNLEQKEQLTLDVILQQIDHLVTDALKQVRSVVLSQINVFK